jgi:hypothetical protein
MATYGEYQTIPGLVATGDLSSSQYKIVIAASTAGAVKVGATAATDPILGVLQNDPTDGQPAEVAFNGICKVLAEASVTYGSEVTVSSTGRAKTTTTDGNRIIGIALEASSTAGDAIRVLLSLHDRYLA